MAMLDKVVHIIEGFLGNPFDIAAEMSRRAKEALLSLRVATAMRHLLGAGQVEQAKLLILSVGHYRACQSHATPDQIFPVSILPRAVAARLPRSRGDYLRVVAAAGRCYRKLAGIRGSSALLQRARREAWAACFGDSLRHALDLGRTVLAVPGPVDQETSRGTLRMLRDGAAPVGSAADVFAELGWCATRPRRLPAPYGWSGR